MSKFLKFYTRVATVKEKSLENEGFFQVREKSGNFNFSQGNLEKMIKVRQKVREFEKFPKKSIGKKVLKIIISINCKWLMIRNTT